MLHTLEVYFLLFISYAILGWCMEVIVKLIEKRKFINRGFLIGPYCPIYGWGAIAITILLKRYLEDPLILFVMSVIICSILEYATSYIMEKRFHARWWDYSDKKYNINGRICLETLIPFGLLGLFVMYVTNPMLLDFYELIPDALLTIISSALFVIFVADNVVSSNIIASIDKEGKKLLKDSTEEITQKVKEILFTKSKLHRRLMNAYPNLKDIQIKLKKKEIKEAKKEDEG